MDWRDDVWVMAHAADVRAEAAWYSGLDLYEMASAAADAWSVLADYAEETGATGSVPCSGRGPDGCPILEHAEHKEREWRKIATPSDDYIA